MLKCLDVAVLLLVTVVSLQTFTIFVPLLSLAADQKCSNEKERGTATGFLLSAPPLVVFIVSPLFGRSMRSAGARLVLILGATVAGGSALLLGFSDRSTNWRDFLIIAYTLSIAYGVGTAALMTATFSLLIKRFPHLPGAVVSVMEVLDGISDCTGPAVGGVLWSAGRGKLLLSGVVAVSSSMAAISLFCLISFLVSWTETNNHSADVKRPSGDDHSDDGGNDVTLKDILSKPRTWMILLLSTFAQLSMSFFYPSLSLFLKHQFQLHDSQLGLGTAVGGMGYVLGAICFGYATDMCGPRRIIAMGLLLSALGFATMGPSGIFGVKPLLPAVFIGQIVVGIGASGVFVTIAKYMLETMEQVGFGRSDQLANLVGSLQQASLGLGQFLGPSIGGGLTVVLGFQNVTTLLAACSLTLLVVFAVAVFWERDSPLRAHLQTCMAFLQGSHNKERSDDAKNNEVEPLTDSMR